MVRETEKRRGRREVREMDGMGGKRKEREGGEGVNSTLLTPLCTNIQTFQILWSVDLEKLLSGGLQRLRYRLLRYHT